MKESTFLVTGGSKGIGSSIACAMAEQGTQVIILALDSEELSDTEEKIQALSSSSFAITCDLSKELDIQNAANVILSKVKILDGIVHNAGVVSPIKPISSVNISEWNNSMQVNFIAVQNLTQKLYSLMKASTHCRVSTISSSGSLNAFGSWSSSCVSKAALDMWAKCLAKEGKDEGISAIAIDPGIVDTDAQKEIRSTPKGDFPSLPAFIDNYENGLLAHPNEVAEKILPLITKHTMAQSGLRFDAREL